MLILNEKEFWNDIPISEKMIRLADAKLKITRGIIESIGTISDEDLEKGRKLIAELDSLLVSISKGSGDDILLVEDNGDDTFIYHSIKKDLYTNEELKTIFGF